MSQDRSALLQYAKDQVDIIRFNPDDTSCNKPKTTDEQQKARAVPNTRLKLVFGIDNAFTNDEPGGRYKGYFVNQAKKKMQAAIRIDGPSSTHQSEDWTWLRAVVRDSAREYILQRDSDDRADDRINLAEMTQYVTLKTSIAYLYPDSTCKTALESPESFHAIRFIGKRINDLWEASKFPTAYAQWAEEEEMHRYLRVVIPPIPGDVQFKQDLAGMNEFERTMAVAERERDPEAQKGNPMNWLLPAYETMWRVVMRCFLEIRYRHRDGRGNHWESVLQRYVDHIKHPSEAGNGAFSRRDGHDAVSAKDIVKEALRLYPPSRRVHRQFSDDPSSEPTKADIEKCHHSTLLGGSDALRFRPERWRETETQYDSMKSNALSQNDHEFRNYQAYLKKRGKESQDSVKTYEEYLGFIPFATYCPSDMSNTAGFSMKLIALFVAAINGAIAVGEYYELDDNLPDLEIPLKSERKAYGDLFLQIYPC